jgi:hypothetical protein
VSQRDNTHRCAFQRSSLLSRILQMQGARYCTRHLLLSKITSMMILLVPGSMANPLVLITDPAGSKTSASPIQRGLHGVRVKSGHLKTSTCSCWNDTALTRERRELINMYSRGGVVDAEERSLRFSEKSTDRFQRRCRTTIPPPCKLFANRMVCAQITGHTTPDTCRTIPFG